MKEELQTHRCPDVPLGNTCYFLYLVTLCYVNVDNMTLIHVIVSSALIVLGYGYCIYRFTPYHKSPLGCSGVENESSYIFFNFAATDTQRLNLAFRFDIREISEIDDRRQYLSVPMYFSVAWLESRIWINETATAWDENVTGPPNVSNGSATPFI